MTSTGREWKWSRGGRNSRSLRLVLGERIREAIGLTSTERLLLFVIVSHVNDTTGNAYPGTERLAKETALTERTIERTRASCQAKGWLEWTPFGGPNRTHLYRVTPTLEGVREAKPKDKRPLTRTPNEARHPDPLSGSPPSRSRQTIGDQPDTRSTKPEMEPHRASLALDGMPGLDAPDPSELQAERVPALARVSDP